MAYSGRYRVKNPKKYEGDFNKVKYRSLWERQTFKWLDNNPGIRVFANCKNLIRTLSALPTDDKNPEDVDTNAEDHAYDALRYGCMSRPLHPKYAARFRRPTEDFEPQDTKFGY